MTETDEATGLVLDYSEVATAANANASGAAVIADVELPGTGRYIIGVDAAGRNGSYRIAVSAEP